MRILPTRASVISWIKAARLPSQTYIFLPLLLGEAIALNQGSEFDTWRFVAVHLFGLAIQLYIVFANDYADQETDRNNVTFTPFSGGSRVLVDGDLRPTQILRAAIIMALTSIGLGGILCVMAESMVPLIMAILGVLLLFMYSYVPVKLSYKGGGEFLQMIGVGIVLPVMGYTAFMGSVDTFLWEVLCVVLPTQLACAIGTAEPDEPSDRADRKKTIPVLLGPSISRRLVISLHGLTAVQVIFLHAPANLDGVLLLLILLVASVIGQLFFIKSKAGEAGVLTFTFLSILSTLTSMGILCIHFWP